MKLYIRIAGDPSYLAAIEMPTRAIPWAERASIRPLVRAAFESMTERQCVVCFEEEWQGGLPDWYDDSHIYTANPSWRAWFGRLFGCC